VTIKLSRLARGLNIKGQGHVMWVACNMEGLLRVIKVPAKKSISWVLLHWYKPTLENKSSSKTLSLPWVENQATLLEAPSLLWSTSLTTHFTILQPKWCQHASSSSLNYSYYCKHQELQFKQAAKGIVALALPSRLHGLQKDSVTNEIRHAEPHSRHLQSAYCSLKDHDTTMLFCFSVQKTD
jgi:hypothetical protein